MKVLLVEDDHLQAACIRSTLEKHFTVPEIVLLSTVRDFHNALPTIAALPPDIIILDVLLRYDTPEGAVRLVRDESDAAARDYFYRSGLECLEAILTTPATAATPTILYSVLSREEIWNASSQLPPHIRCLEKGADDARLVRQIRSMLGGLPNDSGPHEPVTKTAWDSVEAKPGAFGFSIDLKRLFSRRREAAD